MFAAVLVYGGTVALYWKRAGSKLAGGSSPQSTARRVETAAPQLQGILLSAVELATPNAAIGDSLQLREELQKRAAQQVTSLHPSDFLRSSLLKRDAQMLVAAVLLLTLGVALDGTRFGTRCLRVLLPLTSIQRPSDTEIQLHQPEPLDGFTPANEGVTVTAKIRDIKGRRVTGAIIQAQSPGAGRFAVAMTEVAPGYFNASLPVSDTPIQYHVASGDAVTSVHRLDPRHRPVIRIFEKNIVAPAYTGIPDKFETSADGLISVLEGSVVEVSLKASEPITSGTLVHTTNGKEEIIASAIDPKDQTLLRTRLQVNGQGFYSVKLVSQTTGFKSSNDLQWEVRSEPDAPPVIQLHIPEKDLFLQMGAKVPVTGTAEDDYGLESVIYEVQHNRGAWAGFPHAGPSAKHLGVSISWDPLAHSPKIGDTFSMRLVAFDTKGQRAESRTVKFSMTSAATLSNPDPALAFHKSLSRLVSETQKQAAEALKSLTEAKAAYDAPPATGTTPALALLRAEQTLASAGTNAEAASKAVLNEIASEDKPANEEALETQARALNRLLHSDISDAIQSVSKLRSPDDSERSRDEEADLLKRATESAARASSMARLLQDAANSSAASAEAPMLAAAAAALAAENTTAAESPREAATPAQSSPEPSTLSPSQSPSDGPEQEALRRKQVVQAASAQLQKELQALGEKSPSASQKLNAARSSLRDAQAKAENALKGAQTTEGQPSAPAALAKAAATHSHLLQTLEQTAKALSALSPALLEAETKALKRLNEETQQGSDRLSKAIQDLAAVSNKKKLGDSYRDGQTASRLQVEADVLRADADLEAIKRNSAPDAARDLEAAADAIEELSRSDIRSDELRSKVQATAAALKTLEGVTAFKEAMEAAKDTVRSQAMHPDAGPAEERKLGDTLSKKLQPLPQQLKRSNLPTPLADAAQSALAALSKREANSPAAALSLLSKADPHLEEPARLARASLGALSPPLSSKMERLSQDAKASAARAADRAKKADPSATRPAIDLPEVELTKRIDRLRQDLRTEANTQDTLSEAGRVRARDADDAAAQLKASSDALRALQNAPMSKAEAAASMSRTADQQNQLASQLKQMAEHFKALESGAAQTAAQSRQALREMEQRTGAKASLEAREERAKTVSDAASASAEALEEKLKQLASQSASPPAPGAAAVESLLKEAAEALKAGDASKAAAAASGAVDKQKHSERMARASDSGTLSKEPSTSESASGTGDGSIAGRDNGAKGLPNVLKPGGGDWGRLPQKVANDLMEGKRESAPNEYRSAVDAYFKTVAEKARGRGVNP